METGGAVIQHLRTYWNSYVFPNVSSHKKSEQPAVISEQPAVTALSLASWRAGPRGGPVGPLCLVRAGPAAQGPAPGGPGAFVAWA